MKMKKLELDVDLIGGEGPLTNEEEKAITDFLKQRKLLSKKAAKTTPSKLPKRASNITVKV